MKDQVDALQASGNEEGEKCRALPREHHIFSCMRRFILTEDESIAGVLEWFNQFGPTHTNYLRAHYARYLQTRDFALSIVPEERRLRILDIGAHWLHNAFFYANQGHDLVVVDAPGTLTRRSVQQAAAKMGAETRPTKRMEKADGLVELEENSIDLVLFCEVIEHLAFNPIPFWKQVYRVMKPGGRIIITTPNAFYFRSLNQRITRLFNGESVGLTVSQILSVGTYGHHWKEYTLDELRSYFTYLSPEFDASRSKLIYRPGEENIAIPANLEKIIAGNVDLRAYNIFLDVSVREKNKGIQVSPPWEPS
jgi:2-polyprenyl-3-methyl-5-hydroxy-6-metoxy-1,4-benzoquinol methylase